MLDFRNQFQRVFTEADIELLGRIEEPLWLSGMVLRGQIPLRFLLFTLQFQLQTVVSGRRALGELRNVLMDFAVCIATPTPLGFQ